MLVLVVTENTQAGEPLFKFFLGANVFVSFQVKPTENKVENHWKMEIKKTMDLIYLNSSFKGLNFIGKKRIFN